MRGDIQDYARAAAGHLTAGGVFACIVPDEQRARVEAAPGTLKPAVGFPPSSATLALLKECSTRS
jgi:hypothetical protein